MKKKIPKFVNNQIKLSTYFDCQEKWKKKKAYLVITFENNSEK